jgi:hypothetical protein
VTEVTERSGAMWRQGHRRIGSARLDGRWWRQCGNGGGGKVVCEIEEGRGYVALLG